VRKKTKVCRFRWSISAEWIVAGWEEVSSQRYEEILKTGSYGGNVHRGQVEGILFGKLLNLGLQDGRVPRSKQLLEELYKSAAAARKIAGDGASDVRALGSGGRYFIVWRDVFDIYLYQDVDGQFDRGNLSLRLECTDVPGEGKIETAVFGYDGDESFDVDEEWGCPAVYALAPDGTKTRLSIPPEVDACRTDDDDAGDG
jgi:hypothetical protein